MGWCGRRQRSNAGWLVRNRVSMTIPRTICVSGQGGARAQSAPLFSNGSGYLLRSADSKSCISSTTRTSLSALLLRPARGLPDRRRLFVRIATDGVRYVGKSLPISRSTQDRKRDAACDPGLSVDVTSQNLPPIAARPSAFRLPARHHRINLIGNVVVGVRTQPYPRITFADGRPNGYNTTVVRLLPLHARYADADCRARFQSSRFPLPRRPESRSRQTDGGKTSLPVSHACRRRKGR